MVFRIGTTTPYVTVENLAEWLGSSGIPQNLSLAAAERWAAGYLGAFIEDGTGDFFFDSWPGDGVFVLPFGNIKELTTIQYRAEGGSYESLDITDWKFGYENTVGILAANLVYLSSAALVVSELPVLWPHFTKSRIKIHCALGFEDNLGADPRIVMAILLKAKHYFENRGDSALTTDDSPDLRTATELLDQVLREIQS